MAVMVNSPYSGRPVKVREQDIGRAVRDEEGKIFYVLQRSEGQGYYGSLTRLGGLREEHRHHELPQSIVRDPPPSAQGQPVHDATGRRASSLSGKLVILVFVLIALGLILLWLFTVGPWGSVEWQTSLPSNQIPVMVPQHGHAPGHA